MGMLVLDPRRRRRMPHRPRLPVTKLIPRPDIPYQQILDREVMREARQACVLLAELRGEAHSLANLSGSFDAMGDEAAKSPTPAELQAQAFAEAQAKNADMRKQADKALDAIEKQHNPLTETIARNALG